MTVTPADILRLQIQAVIAKNTVHVPAARDPLLAFAEAKIDDAMRKAIVETGSPFHKEIELYFGDQLEASMSSVKLKNEIVGMLTAREQEGGYGLGVLSASWDGRTLVLTLGTPAEQAEMASKQREAFAEFDKLGDVEKIRHIYRD